MELQKAIILLQLEGKTLTEEVIKEAYNTIAEPIQMEAIDAPTSELIKQSMDTLDSLNQAQTTLLDSIDEPNAAGSVVEPSVDMSIDINSIKEAIISRQDNTQKPSIDSPEEEQDEVKPQNNKAAEINKPSKNKSKLAPIFLIALLMGGGAVAYQQGWLNNVIENLNPVDEELLVKQQMEGAQLLTEAQELVQRLDEGQRDISSALEIAESDDNPDNLNTLEELRFRQQLAQEYLVEGSLLSELAEQISQAQNILNNQQSKPKDNLQALQLLKDANSAYQNIWLQFNASQQLYKVQQDALQAQAKLMQALENYKLAMPNETAEAIQLMDTANATKQAWQYTHAISYYQEATPAFVTLLARIEDLQKAKIKAINAEDKVDRTIEAHRLKWPDTEQAYDLMEKAENSSREGDTEVAISTYQKAEEYWQKISGELTEHVKTIKQGKLSQEAKIALAAKREEESKLASVAKRAEEAKRVLEAKRAEEAKLALEAKRVEEAKKTLAEKLTLEKERAEKQAQQAKILKKYVGSLVSIRGGYFEMGSSDGESSEKPIHSVSVKPFKMMAHEVTFAQWATCVSQGACTYLPSDRGWGKSTRPVISVSYNDIINE